jgi:CRP-like cAMP-binding protein
MNTQSEIVARLAQHRTLREAPEAELVWLAEHGDVRHFEGGDLLAPNQPEVLESLAVILSGHFAIYVDHGAGPHKVMDWTGGDVTGLLPYSRMSRPIGTMVVDEPIDALVLHRRYFPDLIREEKTFADLIFFDPYSPKVNSEMWSVDCFRALRDRCQPVANLFTYSMATSIRAGFLVAGFFVGAGQSSGQKEQTTHASTVQSEIVNLLDQRWFDRWQRSSAGVPVGMPLEERERVFEMLTEHLQFVLRLYSKNYLSDICFY